MQGKEKKILFIINTHFQLITSFHILFTIRKGVTADIIVSDYAEDNETICKKIAESNLLRSVFFVRLPGKPVAGSFIHKTIYRSKRILLCLPGRKYRKDFLHKIVNSPFDYDEVWFNNAFAFTHLLWNCYPEADYYRFDEGYSTYTQAFIPKISSRILFRLLFGNLKRQIKGLYLYHGELYCRKEHIPIYSIQLLDHSDKKFINTINTIFQYPEHSLLDKAKVIFFEESFREDGKRTEDIRFIKKIVQIVGKDSILIKRHPRSHKNPFEHLGIKTDREIDRLPWELIQLNEPTNHLVLLSISSGSLLSSALYFSDPVPSYYLYKCLNHKPENVNTEFESFLDKVIKNAPWIKVIDNPECIEYIN